MSELCETAGIIPEILTVQVISQPLMCPIGMTAFLLGGLSLLRAAVVAVVDKLNVKGRGQRSEKTEGYDEAPARHFVCVAVLYSAWYSGE